MAKAEDLDFKEWFEPFGDEDVSEFGGVFRGNADEVAVLSGGACDFARGAANRSDGAFGGDGSGACKMRVELEA